MIVSLKPKNEIETLLIEAEKKKYRARIRLYRALLENRELPLKLTSEKLGITAAMLKPLVEKEIVDLKTVKKDECRIAFVFLWYSRRESNPHRNLRRVAFYPLKYGDGAQDYSLKKP